MTIWSMTRYGSVLLVTSALLMVRPGPARAQPVRAITLAETVTLAMQNNLQLRASAFEVAIARTQLNQALATRAGTVTASTSYTRSNEREPTMIVIPAGTVGNLPPLTISLSPVPPDLLAASVIYQYPLYTGGRVDAQIALTAANLRGAEATLERITLEVLLDVKQAYFQQLLAQAGVEVGERALAQAQELLRVAQARVGTGAAPQFDEVQASVNVANARQALVRARNGVALATHALNTLLALPLDRDVRLLDAMVVLPVRTELARLITRALAGRPEVAEVKAREAAARAAIEIVRSGGRPALVLTAGPNLTGPTSGSLTFGWSATLAVTAPVFDGHLTAERIREAELRLDQLKLTAERLRQSIELDVRQATLNIRAAEEELRSADAIVAQAQEGLRIATARFEGGVGTNLEAISAQASVAQAEGNKVQALFNYNIARAQLERAVGGAVE